MIKNFKELIVWQKSMNLVEIVYKLIEKFPPKEMYCLSSQIRRCAISVPSNIAEGYGRHSTGDYKRFLRISRASLYELQTQIEISRRLEYTTYMEISKFEILSTEIDKMLNTMIKKLK